MSKFDSALAANLYEWSLEGAADEEIGSVDELGWYGRFDGEQAILHEDSQGFVYATEFATRESLKLAWEEIEAEYALFDLLNVARVFL